MRLAGVEKAGFYPTPDRCIELIAGHIRIEEYRPGAGRGALLDPCCGYGAAVLQLAQALHPGLTPYGIELDHVRAAGARELLGDGNAVQASIEQVTISDRCEIELLNPPYDEVRGERIELKFIDHGARFLAKDGLLILILTERLFTEERYWRALKRCLEKNDLRNTVTLRFPQPEYRDFKQVVMLAKKQNYGFVEREIVGELGAVPVTRGIYLMGSSKVFALAVNRPEEVNPLWWDTDLTWANKVFGNPKPDYRALIPLLPMGDRHAVLVAAAGLLNGSRLTDTDGTVYVIKGKTTKRTVKRVIEREDGNESFAETEINVVTLTLVNMTTGAVERFNDLDHKTRFEAFVLRNAAPIVTMAQELYPSLVTDADLAYWAARTDRLRAPDTPLPGYPDAPWPAQSRSVAALLTGALKGQHKVMTLCGVQGTGKTTVASGYAALLMERCRSDAGRHTVILVPPKDDLIDKWGEEFSRVVSRVHPVKIFKPTQIHEVQEAFAEPWSVIVLRNTAAKTQSGWRPAAPFPRAMHIEISDRKYDTRGEAETHIKDPVNQRAVWQHNPEDGPRDHSDGWWAIATRTHHYVCRCGRVVRWEGGTRMVCNHKFPARKLTPYDPVPSPHARCQEAWWRVAYSNGKDKAGLDYPTWLEQIAAWRAQPWYHIFPPKITGGRTADLSASWPLARFIRQHYARRYVLINDEAHQTKASDTDIAYAATDLYAGAEHVLQMTGTLFGGLASSVFYLLYRALPEFRALYERSEVQSFIDAYGLMEEITTFYPEYKGDSLGGYREFTGSPHEVPGIAPGMAAWLLPTTVFLNREDLNIKWAEKSERVLLVDPTPEMAASIGGYLEAVKSEAVADMRDGDKHLMAAWGQAKTGIWDVPHIAESLGMNTFNGLEPPEPHGLFPKEEAFIRWLWGEHLEGRKVLVAVAQIARRNCTNRYIELLARYGLKGVTLYSTEKKRKAFLEAALRDGADCAFMSPGLVEVGINLEMFHSVAWLGICHNMTTVDQFNCRPLRPRQTKDVRIVYFAYNDTYQAAAWMRTAAKQRGLQSLQGYKIDGLSRQLTDEDFVQQLSEAVSADLHYDSEMDLAELPPLPPLRAGEFSETLSAAESESTDTPVLELHTLQGQGMWLF